MKKTGKHILNQQQLEECHKKAKKRLRWMILGFFLLVGGTFLILLIPRPANLYVLLLDVSESMSQPMDLAEGKSKMDIAKESIMRFVGECGSSDYFLLATFGPGNCDQKGLAWIQSNPGKCGGTILVSISNDKLQVYEELTNIQSVNVNTHLSEGLFKVLNHLERVVEDSPNFRKIEALVIGDGQDHCQAIKEGNSVALLPWSFSDKMRINTIAVQVVDEEASANLHTLANDGNGEFVDVYNASEFYNKLKVIFPIGPEWIILIHLAIAVLLFLLLLLILRV
jgi:hypothetical protein